MIGFDVRYGNPTFIHDGQNGYLLPYDRLETVNQHIDLMASAIGKLFNSDLPSFSEASYQVAEKYKSKKVAKLWKKAIESEL